MDTRLSIQTGRRSYKGCVGEANSDLMGGGEKGPLRFAGLALMSLVLGIEDALRIELVSVPQKTTITAQSIELVRRRRVGYYFLVGRIYR